MWEVTGAYSDKTTKSDKFKKMEWKKRNEFLRKVITSVHLHQILFALYLQYIQRCKFLHSRINCFLNKINKKLNSVKLLLIQPIINKYE